MEVKIKKLHPNAVIPKYESAGAAGMDLTATSKTYDDHGNVVYGTGIAIQVPQGYYADLRPRSSISKYDLVLANSIGTIDSDYTGELIFKFKLVMNCQKFEKAKQDGSAGFHLDVYNVGDRIGQIIIMPYPKIEFVEVDELDKTERGNGGFASTDK